MSDLDYERNTNDETASPGLMCRCRWHGYYSINTGCERCRKEEVKQALAQRRQRLNGIFDNVVWLKE
ncbi:MAG: hypothetical protein PHR56_00300 [Dehalococcoidales bacterium]|nr:hypothetical protein [Dehalococcoidales bacterium]